MTDMDLTGTAIQVPAATLSVGSAWALRQFGEHTREYGHGTPSLRRYVVPERADITAVVPGALDIDVVALVPVNDDDELVDHGRMELVLAILGVGDRLKDYRSHSRGPRLLGPHPSTPDAWVYFLGADRLLGGATVHDERMHMRGGGGA